MVELALFGSFACAVAGGLTLVTAFYALVRWEARRDAPPPPK